MKNQNLRLMTQIIGLVLTAVGLFIKFKWTMGIILFVMILSGTYYCGWICPFGTIQEWASKLGSLLKIKKRKLPKKIHNILKYLRYINFVLLSLLTSSIIFELLALDPRNNFTAFLTGNSVAYLSMGVLVAFTVLSMFYERFFCNYLCSEGAKFGLFSIFRPVTIRRDDDKCINCGKCDRSCPMSITVSKTKNLRSPNCINCFKCVDSCPVENTLNYGFKSKTRRNKYILLVIILMILAVPSAILLKDKISVEDIKSLPEELVNSINESLFDKEIVDVELANTFSLDDINDDISNEVVEEEAPLVEEETPPVEEENPPIEEETPPVEEETPPVEEETPPVEEETPPVEEETPPVEEETPPVEEETPPVEEETPPVEEETPPVEEETPPVEEETPPVEEETPPVEEETPPVEEDTFIYNDGVYSGVGSGYKGNIYVEITVESDRITEIQVLEHNDDAKWYNRATDIIYDILKGQTTDVDTISGATYSSGGIKDAVIDALEKAK